MNDRLASSNELCEFQKVVGGGYCIGCGGCAAINPDSYKIEMCDTGVYQAELHGDEPHKGLTAVCPFSDTSPDEDQHADALATPNLRKDPSIGYWRGLYAGHIENEDDRVSGGSGGLTTWLLRRLIETGIVDAVAHVKPGDPEGSVDGPMFEYGLSRTVEELDEGRKSRYYPVELSGVLNEIRSRPGRYAIVALPCFAKMIRNLQREDDIFRERIVLVIGLVCGHLKSKQFAEYLGWLTNVPPRKLASIDFRRKIKNFPASQYTVEAFSEQSSKTGLPLRNYFATSWEVGLMRYAACEFCDDVFAETADIVFGDAWIAPFDQDWRGYNVVVTRDPSLEELLIAGERHRQVRLVALTPEQMVHTQAGGLRHRRRELSIRLEAARRSGRWAPRKRVGPMASDNSTEERKFLLRSKLSALSQRAFLRARDAGHLSLFYGRMSYPIFRYYLLTSGLSGALKETVLWKALKRRNVASKPVEGVRDI